MSQLVSFEQLVSGAEPDAEGGREAVPAAPGVPLEESLAELIAQSGLLSIDNLPKLLTRGIRKRRAAPIHGYNGLNGNFKSWAAVRDCLPSIAMGRKILSTVAILDPESGNPHPLYVPFRHFSQLAMFRDGDVLMDEITGVMDSGDTQSLPGPVRTMLPQMRRNNVRIAYTGIDWDNTNKRLRQLTWASTHCRGHLPNHQLVRQQNAETPAELKMWAPNRLAFLTTYDAATLKTSEDTKQLAQDQSKQNKAKRAKVLVRELAWAPSSLTFKCYNTLDAVLSVDNYCGHGLTVPKPGLCKDPHCAYEQHIAWAAQVVE